MRKRRWLNKKQSSGLNGTKKSLRLTYHSPELRPFLDTRINDAVLFKTRLISPSTRPIIDCFSFNQESIYSATTVTEAQESWLWVDHQLVKKQKQTKKQKQ